MFLTRRKFLAASAAAAAAACTRTSAPKPTSGAGDAPAAEPEVADTSRKNMKLLILGGTGFLGPHVVAYARERGHTVTLFNRGKSDPDLFDEVTDVETLLGDRDGKLEALAGRKWDVVVDTSGYVPRIVKMSADFLAPNVEQYLFVSTISVYADDIPAHSTEEAKLATALDETTEEVKQYYGALKALSEKAAEAAMPGRVTVVRPGLIVGPRDPTDRFTYWPLKLGRGGEVLAPGDGKDAAQYVDVRDLAAFIVTALENRLTKTYNAVGPADRREFMPFLERQASALEAKPTLTWVPAEFLLAQNVQPWGDLPLWIPRGEGDGFTSISSARAIADGLAFRPLEETAKDTMTWWKTLPEERRAKLRGGLTDAREAEVLALWKAASTSK